MESSTFDYYAKKTPWLVWMDSMRVERIQEIQPVRIDSSLLFVADSTKIFSQLDILGEADRDQKLCTSTRHSGVNNQRNGPHVFSISFVCRKNKNNDNARDAHHK